MPVLDLVIAPNPIFKQQAETVDFKAEGDAIKPLIADLFDTLYHEKGLGLAATMVGILKRIVVVDLMEDGEKCPKAYINPEVIYASDECQDHVEASLCYPGIEATITRPKHIKVSYLDEEGNACEEEAEDFRATVIQHEIDYLNGRVFLEYVKPVKRQMLITKMKKYKKMLANGRVHVHGPDCGHDH